MKVALLGAGKTGGKVADLHSDTIIFNSKNIPTLDKLEKCDIVISFLAGDIFKIYIPMLIESKIPVVTGSTGFEWNDDDIEKIKKNNLKWVKANNFSLGMNIVKNLIEVLGKSKNLYPDANFFIHDIHHTQKKDAPSGTALSWRDWLGSEASITSERTGDVIGYHHMEMISEFEKIKITHEATDRSIFASGALWAAHKLMDDKSITSGLHHFSDIVNKHLNI